MQADGQLTIFDVDSVVVVNQKNAWELFHEHCKHGGATRYNEELGRTQHLCGFANGKSAQCWADWIECKECDCYIVRKEGDI